MVPSYLWLGASLSYFYLQLISQVQEVSRSEVASWGQSLEHLVATVKFGANDLKKGDASRQDVYIYICKDEGCMNMTFL